MQNAALLNVDADDEIVTRLYKVLSYIAGIRIKVTF
jgi:hypothetical protein